MDSEGSQVPSVPAGPRRLREGWPMVDIVSASLKILGWIVLFGSIIGGIYIASALEPSCDCTGYPAFHCDCTDPTNLQIASVIGGVAGGLSTALLFWALAFILDMVEEIWIESGGHLPRAVAEPRTAPKVGGEDTPVSSVGGDDAPASPVSGEDTLGEISWPPSLKPRE